MSPEEKVMKIIKLFYASALTLLLPLTLQAQEPVNCQSCHGDKELKKDLAGGKTQSLFVEQKDYLQSVHGNLSCTSCHAGITDAHPQDQPGKVDCGSCHSQEAEAYKKSIHAQVFEADPEAAPGCVSCHGTHQIQKSNTDKYKKAALDQCSRCHADYQRTYLDTYHGKVVNLGYMKDMPLCWDCHSAHDILPASDPQSNVSKERVLATCLYCHPDANTKFSQYNVHSDKFSVKKDPVSFWTYLVMVLIVCFAFGLWVPHTILWFVRDWLENRKKKKGPGSNPPTETGGGA
jgi:hypothetical protein